MVKARALLLCAALVASASAARAQAPDDAARSRQAFDEARRRIDAGDCASAVPLLRESVRWYPSVGARLSLAQCLEPNDPAAAWWELTRAERAATASKDERAAIARARAAALLPSIAMLELRDAPVDAAVSVDGVAIDPELAALPFAVAAGARRVAVTARGKRQWARAVDARVGTRMVLEVALEDEPRAPAPPPIVRVASRSVAGPALLGVAAAIATGFAIGFAAAGVSDRDRLRETCGLACARGDIDAAHAKLAAADVLGAVAIATAGAALLWIVWPSRSPARTAALLSPVTP